MACEGVIQAAADCLGVLCDLPDVPRAKMSAYNSLVTADPAKCWPHVPSKADVVVDASGAEMY